MIRLKQREIEYPNRTVLADVIVRSGPASYESFTPFRGCADIVRQQFCGNTQEGKYNERDLINYTASSDFDPAKTNIPIKAGMLVDKNPSARKFRTLEEFVEQGEEDTFRRWVQNSLIGYKITPSSPYRMRQISTNVLTSEEGDATPEQELLVSYEGDKVRNRDKHLLLQKLPYYIRLIWYYSIMYKANLFGFIYAWMDNIYNLNKPIIVIQCFKDPKYVFERLKPDGSHHRYFYYDKDVKDATFKKVTELFINYPLYPTEYNIFKEFASIITALGIDVTKEICTDINKTLVENLRCTYLPTLKEYTAAYNDLDYEVDYAIRSVNLFNTKKIDIYKSSSLSIEENNLNMFYKNATERIKLLYIMAKDHINRGIKSNIVNLMKASRNDVLRLLTEYTYKASGRVINFENIVDVDSGTFVQNKGEIVRFPGAPFGLYRDTREYEVIISTYGFVVVIDGTGASLSILPYEDAIKKLGEENDSRRGTPWVSY